MDKTKSIPAVLKDYESYGGLTLSWMNFGSSGHIERPPGGVLANYNKCYQDFHIKSIVVTDHVNEPSTLTPHHFSYRDGYYAVDTNHTLTPGPANPGEASPLLGTPEINMLLCEN